MLELVCEELGVEVGDSWLGNTGKYYVINEHGQIRVWNDEYNQWIESYYDLSHVVTGKLKPKWKPKDGENYYMPDIKINQNCRHRESVWLNDDIDQWYLSHNMVFRTKEEAEEMANKILEFVKEER